MRVNTAYRVTHLYANGIYAHDECHAMNLVSWIETFIFIRGVVIQMKPMKWCNNIFDKYIMPMKCKNNTILTKNENKRWDFLFAHLRWCHNGWASNILIVGGCWLRLTENIQSVLITGFIKSLPGIPRVKGLIAVNIGHNHSLSNLKP